MTNVLKLDQIWQFQRKNNKNIKFLRTFPLKIFSSPTPNFDADATNADAEIPFWKIKYKNFHIYHQYTIIIEFNKALCDIHTEIQFKLCICIQITLYFKCENCTVFSIYV